MNASRVSDCILKQLPKVVNTAGNITPIQGGMDLPFAIARVYYLYDIPGGESRGGHGHRELQQLIVAATGSFDIVLHDGYSQRRVTLSRAYHGLYLPSGIWRELENFSSGSVCLVLASLPYNESDYFRRWEDFLAYKQGSLK